VAATKQFAAMKIAPVRRLYRRIRVKAGRLVMIPNRLKRLSALMTQTISEVIRKELKDPRIGFVSITDVEISSDLRQAKVFVSSFGDESQKDAAVAGLNSAAGFIYKQIRPEISIKRVPSLRFFRDDSIERGVRVCDVIRRARESDPEMPPEEEA